MQTEDPGNQRVPILSCNIVEILPQNLLDEDVFVLLDSFEHVVPVAGIVEKGAGFA